MLLNDLGRMVYRGFLFGLCLGKMMLPAKAQQTLPGDSLKLPFAIAKEKRLDPEDLANKKEGYYFTGMPDLSKDPLNGFGYGGEGELFYNGKKSDPFFAYTPYRWALTISAFNTTKSQRELFLKLDVPFILNTRWRLRAEGGFEMNPNLLYFGLTEKTLNPLQYDALNDSTHSPVPATSYADYKKQMDVQSPNFNGYYKKEMVWNVSMERSFFEGKLRTLVGYELAKFRMGTFSSTSQLERENRISPIPGLGSGYVSLFQAGLIWDTRDLEADPNQGVFAELTNELSVKKLASQFTFNKTFFHVNYYRRLFPKHLKKCILAARIAAGYTGGAAPFYEYQDQWSSEGSIEGLGGSTTLRGYKQSRFLGRTMSFNNLEIRWRFAQLTLLKQHLAFSAVPFADAGGVWDSMGRITRLQNFRFSEGLGLRVAWNINTILRFDYAVSEEDKQFFFHFGQCF